ncbi:MAG: TIM barrel protein [Bryobacterales bacterium]|nr:TIM barrel protein [Bryobacterales bacterium]
MCRRTFLKSAAVLAAPALSHAQSTQRKGRLKQAVTRGCFGRKMAFEDMLRHAARLGFEGFDLVRAPDLGLVKKYGLAPSMVSGAGSIADNMNHKEFHEKLEPLLRASIRAAAEAGAPNVIVLSGNRRGLSDEEGMQNCLTFLKKVIPEAEDRGVTLCMELLNSKVNHPDYQCDRTVWGVELCKRVNSPRMKLLYDIYHMQIMEGDVIRTIRNNLPFIAHFHTAGNPGRHEMDDTQELNYRGIARAIADSGFQGYVAHEYSPQGDPLESLEKAYKLFEV